MERKKRLGDKRNRPHKLNDRDLYVSFVVIVGVQNLGYGRLEHLEQQQHLYGGGERFGHGQYLRAKYDGNAYS
jgi:hypothetical protein